MVADLDMKHSFVHSFEWPIVMWKVCHTSREGDIPHRGLGLQAVYYNRVEHCAKGCTLNCIGVNCQTGHGLPKQHT